MTKVLPYYSLCPLIEQKYFIGLTQDAKSDHILVTVNGNIISRYMLSSTKQIGSWNTKGSITSPVVYDSSNDRYVGIFNNNEIRLWPLLTENIDKIKKYKFTDKLYTVLKSAENRDLLVVFSNGHFCNLEDAILNRKVSRKSDILDDGEIVRSAEIILFANNLFLVIGTENSNSKMNKLYMISLNNSTMQPVSYNISREGVTCVSYCIVVEKTCTFLSLWSDNKLFAAQLLPSCENFFPGRYLSDISTINVKNGAAMRSLSPYYVAVYGRNSDDEEGALVLFSIKYNFLQCKQLYKQFSNPPQLWNIGSNLFLIIGHNLVVIPCILENQKLSAFVGSGDITKSLINTGDCVEACTLPDCKMYEILTPGYLKEKTTDEVLEIVKHWTDVPDSVIIELLIWCLADISLRNRILNVVFNKHCINDIVAFRSKISIELSMILLEEVTNNFLVNNNLNELIRWATFIIDAYYPQYLFTSDGEFGNKILKLRKIVEMELNKLNDFKELNVAVTCIRRKIIILNKH